MENIKHLKNMKSNSTFRTKFYITVVVVIVILSFIIIRKVYFHLYVSDDRFIFPHGKNAQLYYQAQKLSEEELKNDSPNYKKIIEAYQKVVAHYYAHPEEIGDYPPGQSAPDALVLMATFYERINDTKKAIESLELLIKEFPKSGKVNLSYKMLGDLFYKNQNYKQALEMYTTFLALQPSHKSPEEREKIQKRMEHIQSILNLQNKGD